MTLPTMVLACAATLSSTPLFQNSVPLASQRSGTSFGSSFSRDNDSVVPPLVVCHAKKKLSFMEQILDYIEGGYFLQIPHLYFFALIMKFPFKFLNGSCGRDL